MKTIILPLHNTLKVCNSGIFSGLSPWCHTCLQTEGRSLDGIYWPIPYLENLLCMSCRVSWWWQTSWKKLYILRKPGHCSASRSPWRSTPRMSSSTCSSSSSTLTTASRHLPRGLNEPIQEQIAADAPPAFATTAAAVAAVPVKQLEQHIGCWCWAVACVALVLSWSIPAEDWSAAATHRSVSRADSVAAERTRCDNSRGRRLSSCGQLLGTSFDCCNSGTDLLNQHFVLLTFHRHTALGCNPTNCKLAGCNLELFECSHSQPSPWQGWEGSMEAGELDSFELLQPAFELLQPADGEAVVAVEAGEHPQHVQFDHPLVWQQAKQIVSELKGRIHVKTTHSMV